MISSSSYGSYASLDSGNEGAPQQHVSIHRSDSLTSDTDYTAPINLPRMRASTLLTEKIIRQISNSIKIFRPSKSLQQITQRANKKSISNDYDDDETNKKPTAEIDLVISGGGLKGYFICGCISILQQQLANHNIEIARVSGARYIYQHVIVIYRLIIHLFSCTVRVHGVQCLYVQVFQHLFGLNHIINVLRIQIKLFMRSILKIW